MASCDQRMDVNCDPLSDVICSGVPNRLTQFCSSARASADVSLTGMASGHRVNRSTTVRRCENPSDGGKGRQHQHARDGNDVTGGGNLQLGHGCGDSP